jgi:hypothetical protein
MNYQLIKLAGGEELIGDTSKLEDGSYVIKRPMVFRTTTIMDPRGQPYDVTTLKDWLIRSVVKESIIHPTQVTFISEPTKKTIKMYELELKREEEIDSLFVDLESKNPEDQDQFNMTFDELMKNIMGSPDFVDKRPKPSKKGKRTKLPTQPQRNNIEDMGLDDMSKMLPDELKDRPMVYLSMIIPPEAIMNLITSGVLDPEQLQTIIEEVKKSNKFTGDEKKREDFGSKFSDWNPDPKSDDY